MRIPTADVAIRASAEVARNGKDGRQRRVLRALGDAAIELQGR